MKKTICTLLVLSLLLMAVGLAAAEDITYTSRGVDVPATIVLPEGDGPFPFVVLVHGHGGSRHENIGFPAIADALAAQGIASIRMDFPGCGDSGESFQQNTLGNMKQDVLAAIDTMTGEYPVDTEKAGILGYSMGGRIALELLAEKAYDFKAVALLAPAAQTEGLKGLFGGDEGWQTLRAEAESNGFAVFTTIYGQVQELSLAWFEDLEANMDPTADAAAAYAGNAVVIYAAEDEAVSADISQAVAEAFGAAVIHADGDGHSYGFYSDKTEVLETVANGAADFFAGELK